MPTPFPTPRITSDTATADRPPNDGLRHLSIAEALEALGEAHCEGGQRIRDQSTPQIVNEGKGLWILRPNSTGGVTDDSFETEVLLTGRRIKAYTCSCAAFAKTATCDHLAAILGIVRLSKLPKSRPTQVRSKSTVSTKALLQHVEHADLVSFVIERAKADADLSLELRVRFAHLTNLNDRYGAVLDRLLVRQGKRFNPKELRRLSAALTHFAALREGWLAQRHWLDLFEIDTTLAERLVVVADKLVDTRVDASAYVATLLAELTTVVRAKPAPVVAERIGEWLDEQRERGAYYRLDLDAGFYPLAAALGASPDETVAEIAGALQRFGESPARLRTYLAALRDTDQQEAARALLVQHLHDPHLVFEALEADVAAGHLERAARFAEEALPHTTDRDLRTRLLRFVTTLARALDDDGLLARHTPALLLSTGNLEEVLAVMTHLPDETAHSLQQGLLLAVKASRHASSPRQAETSLQARELASLEAELLFRLGDYAALEQEIYRSDDDALVLRLLPRLVGHLDADDVGLLLETKTREHLDAHLGSIPAAYVTQLLDAVARRDRTQLVPVLVERLRDTYGDRRALLEAFKAAAF